jgi:hypothetical protein
MTDIPILPNAYDGTPQINRNQIPQDQMQAFLHVTTLLAELGVYERRLLLAVYLFEYSKQAAYEISDFATLEHALWTTGGWQSIAARDGALSIYHFGHAIKGLQNSMHACPTLNQQVENKKIKAALKIFESAFPDNIEIRNAVAHVAESSKTLEAKTANSVKGPFRKKLFSSEDPEGVTWLPGNINGCTYAVTLRGKVYTYELNLESAAKLRTVKMQIFSAFDAATALKPSS